MIKHILGAIAALLVIVVAAVLIWGPAYIERNINPLSAPNGTWPVSEEARDLHQRLVIGDLHSDALLWGRDLLKRGDRGHTDIPRLAEGNVAVQVLTTVTKSPRGLNYSENSTDTGDNITPLMIGQLRPIATWSSLLARALDQSAQLHRMAGVAPEELRIIRSRGDLAELLNRRAAGARTVGAILGSESGHPLEGDLENLALLDQAGFRIIGLTHFFDNELGGSLHGSDGPDAGLSDFGRAVVADMAKRGMITDLAHASPQMVRDVLALPDIVPILSHTGVYSHCPTPRNLPDDLLRGIAQKGGIVGIGYWTDVNCGSTPADIAASIGAAMVLLGEDHVALGSDYDGAVDAPFDAAGLSALTQALMDAGLTEAQIAKVMGGNMMRYLAQHLPE